MPKEIKVLKEFIRIMRHTKGDDKGKDSKSNPAADEEKLKTPPTTRKIIIKKLKNNVTKFKLRTPRHLITYKAVGADRAEKLRSAIPNNLLRVQINKKRPQKSQ